jgi:hypothetical protein
MGTLVEEVWEVFTQKLTVKALNGISKFETMA